MLFVDDGNSYHHKENNIWWVPVLFFSYISAFHPHKTYQGSFVFILFYRWEKPRFREVIPLAQWLHIAWKWPSQELNPGRLVSKSSLSFLKKIYLFFNWRIIALQNSVGFFQPSTWINHRSTHMSPLSWTSLLHPSCLSLSCLFVCLFVFLDGCTVRLVGS